MNTLFNPRRSLCSTYEEYAKNQPEELQCRFRGPFLDCIFEVMRPLEEECPDFNFEPEDWKVISHEAMLISYDVSRHWGEPTRTSIPDVIREIDEHSPYLYYELPTDDNGDDFVYPEFYFWQIWKPAGYNKLIIMNRVQMPWGVVIRIGRYEDFWDHVPWDVLRSYKRLIQKHRPRSKHWSQ